MQLLLPKTPHLSNLYTEQIANHEYSKFLNSEEQREMANPIRVGFIGLSTQPFPQGWSNATHLPYLESKPRQFQITAVLNSSLASSQRAISEFDLAHTATAFGDLDSFLAHPALDLVIVCVDVAQHYPLAKAALLKGKDVFCEWPLTKDSGEARELLQIAKEKNLKTYTGLESPLSPVTQKLRSLISTGAIGSVISTNLYATLPPTGPAWSEKAIFYLDVTSGQSPLHCRVAHPLEAFCRTLGEFTDFTSRLVTHQKSILVYDVAVAELPSVLKDPESKPSRTVERTAPDEVLIQGQLEGGAAAVVHFHTGANAFDADDRNLRWIITGTEGDIEVTQRAGVFLRDVSVRVRVLKGGKAEDVPLDWEENGEFSIFGEHVVLATPARHYRAIASGDREGIVDFEHGLKRLELLEMIVKGGSRPA